MTWMGMGGWAITGAALLLCVVNRLSGQPAGSAINNADRIRPADDNPGFWQYKGKPILLLGGSIEDNLFQIPDLREHLDLLRSVGGNYVRNTMSSRDEGNVWPFEPNADGKYDLNKPNREYWRRFESLLQLACERDIIVQIEMWDRFDFAREPWLDNPYNPANNFNYTTEQTGLQPRYDRHPGNNDNPFFRTVPALENNVTVLKYQQAQVDQMLSISLKYPNVLYCMDNETSGRPEWGAYWAQYIRAAARRQGVDVHTTEMWDPWDLSDPMHRNTTDHPELYTFVDISQNNHQKGQAHWDNMQALRQRLADRPRPINTVKIYGADTGRFGTDRDGIERYWRNIFGGLAATRFHRPTSGLGLNEMAQTQIRSARMLANEFDFPSATPDASSQLLVGRQDNHAYLTRIGDQAFAIVFLDGGQVGLDLQNVPAHFTLRWLEIDASRWHDAGAVEAGRVVPLKTPGAGRWVALLKRAN